MFVLLGAFVVGLTLGMLGSGGSAITVPVLVYLVGHEGKVSIAESMAIVGLISVVTAIPYARRHQVDWRKVIFFGLPGMLGTFAGASLGGMATEAIQLVVFGIVLLVAAYSMLPRRTETAKSTSSDPTASELPQSDDDPAQPPPVSLWKIGLQGTAVGITTGFVGVGGGFLIVPALVILGRVPMRLAVGTSLVIIAANAAVGFAKYDHYLSANGLSVDSHTIATFAILGTAGAFLGRFVNGKMNQATLRTVFAAFLLILGAFVIIREGSQLF